MVRDGSRGVPSATAQKWRLWLELLLCVAAGFIAAAVIWYFSRGTVMSTNVDCMPDCGPWPKAPDWEHWGLPISCVILGLALGALIAMKRGLLYKLMMQHKRRDGELTSYPRQYLQTFTVLYYFVNVVGVAALVCMLAGTILLPFVWK